MVDPVRVQNSQVGATTTDTLLSGGLEGTLVLELVDTLVGRLACAIVSMVPTQFQTWFSYHR